MKGHRITCPIREVTSGGPRANIFPGVLSTIRIGGQLKWTPSREGLQWKPLGSPRDQKGGCSLGGRISCNGVKLQHNRFLGMPPLVFILFSLYFLLTNWYQHVTLICQYQHIKTKRNFLPRCSHLSFCGQLYVSLYMNIAFEHFGKRPNLLRAGYM